MHQKIAALALALGMLLCGCKAAKETDGAQQALDFRSRLLNGGCSFQAELTADYGTFVQEFSLACEYSAQEGTRMCIQAPESLAGICAEVSKDGAKLVFDGTEAAFGDLAGRKVSAMAAPQILASAWAESYISLTGKEDGALRVTYLSGYDEDELTIDTWFSDGAPVRAEIACGGRTVLQAKITDFIIQEADYEDTQTNLGGYFAGQSGA